MTNYRVLSMSIAMLVGLVVVPTSFAQSASTGPNKVYIEQIGNTNTITIQQTGGSNDVGGTTSATPGSTNYGTITGSANTLSITQTGDTNLNQYNIRGSTNIYSSTITGNTNSSKLVVGDTTTPALRNTLTETVLGNTNILDTTVVASDVVSTIAIAGNTNEVTSILRSSRGVSDIDIAGNNNKLEIDQLDAAGANGHLLKQVIVGNYNSITTQQQGTNDTTVDLKTTGDQNTITIRTSSTAIAAPKTAVAR